MAKILKISEAAVIGIHTMALLASYPDKQFSTKEIAESLHISPNHLAKVLQTLTKNNHVKPIRGPKGGFVINKPYEKTTLLDIYESIDGSMDNGNCLFDYNICRMKKCVAKGLVHEVRTKVKEILSAQRLIDLKDNIKNK